ncbi:phosphatidylinositol-glycan biosynthesis class W protein-like [Daktulosphaira vitifoliae]|uniref:phosphatidylinositol-glycan biosynthesis class W protein-like n=1 Tax=Daktulosphaira vitifoliae TaxID=58002 RepID=UPI0021AAB8D9|nr:phosphatidylinositol-glycan biosynthesis class W protein-like [Daktulosphaira vitifoliae]
MDVEYKVLHNKAISSQKGSPLLEIYMSLFSLPVHIIIFAWISIITNYSEQLSVPRIWKFVLEFIFLILPTVLNLTILSEFVVAQFIIYFLVAVISLFFILLNRKCLILGSIRIKKNPYMSVYRFILNTYTVFCILAVDFNVFPRKYAKTEKYGHSIMDIGVGLYVCSNALLFKTPKVQNFFKQSIKVVKQVLPLLVLGIGRVYFIKKTNYNHYVFEYGVHWNFFITLACLKIINLFIIPFISTCYTPILATTMILLYEIALNFGLSDWIMSDSSRDTFFSANREVAVSFDNLTGISRRLVNAGYVFWMLSVSSYLLFMSILIENFITVMMHRFNKKFSGFSLIIDSVNENLLFFFLFANILTGIVNMSIHTLQINTIFSLFILFLYMYIVYIVIYMLHNNKIKSQMSLNLK